MFREVEYKKMDMLGTGILLNVVFIVILLRSYLYAPVSVTAIQFGMVLASGIMILTGSLALIKKEEISKNYRSVVFFSWFVATYFMAKSTSYYLIALYGALSELAIFWILLYIAVKTIFAGYYWPIRKIIKKMPIVIMAFVILLVSGLSYTNNIISYIIWQLSIVLFLIPVILLFYLCVVHYRKTNNKQIKVLIMLGGIISGSYIICIGIATINTVIGRNDLIPYFLSAITFIAIFGLTMILYGDIDAKDGKIFESIKFVISFWIIMVLSFGIGFYYSKNIIMGLIIVIMMMTFVMIYKVMMLIYNKNKSKQYKERELLRQYYEIEKENKIRNFLHDEVLQDIFALKLQLESEEEKGEHFNEISCLDQLQNRIRGEMENYGVDIEKSMSFFENLQLLLSKIENRYYGNKMIVNLNCDKNIALCDHLDQMVYNWIKELVTNAYKHGDGESCEVNIVENKKALYISVNSSGELLKITPEMIRHSGGLTRVKLGVEALNGTLNCIANKDGGLNIQIEI